MNEWSRERHAQILNPNDMFGFLLENSEISGEITRTKHKLGLTRKATMRIVAKQMFEDFCDREQGTGTDWTLKEACIRSCRQLFEC